MASSTSTGDDRRLRAVTYLSPGLPLALFRLVAAELAAALGLEAELRVEGTRSGPPPGEVDPFTAGSADVAFMCAPPYLALAAAEPSPVRLVGAAPVFDDPRNGGRPVYFTEVIVRRGEAALDLARARWGCNDECSLSGYRCVAHELGSLPGIVMTGAHETSLRALLAGEIDAAAIDANVLRRLRDTDPSLADRLEVVRTWGPYPVQPLVAASRLGDRAVEAMADRLLRLPERPGAAAALAATGVVGFEPVDAGELRAALSWLG